MNAIPKIAICIPTYNGEAYLHECLESCINQSFQDYEIVICDDGSTDGTVAIIDSYINRSSRIKFLKNDKNLGLVGNWNRCLAASNAEWIKFVFQDDYISQDCLQEFFEQVGPDTKLVISKRNFVLPQDVVDADKDYYNHSVRTLENTGHYNGNHFSARIISTLAVHNICLNFMAEPSLVMFKKDVINLIGDFDSDFKQICDLEFLQRLGTNFGLQYLPKKNCFFRIHQQSTTVKNVNANYFYLRHIEPVLLAHKMLYAEVYGNFRQSLSFWQLYHLRTYFKVRTFESYLYSTNTSSDKELFLEICNKYPEIGKASEASHMTKLKYFILKLVRKLR